MDRSGTVRAMAGVEEAEQPEEPLDAGGIADWLSRMQAVLRGEADADVPCGTCTGCCTSSQFVHIAPDETDALAQVPAELLFPAPGLPRGHVLLGYDERGHCPMLVDGACTIYAHRPRTCRIYDCRVLTAAGLDLDDDPAKSAIARRVTRWRFDIESDEDRLRSVAVRAAVESIRAELARRAPTGPGPSVTDVAVRAVEIHERFLPPVPT